MFQFIVIDIFMIAVGVVLYLIVRALPRIDEGHGPHFKTTVLEHWLTSEMPERIDRVLNSFLGKFIRRTKIVLMKVDNVLTNRLKKIKTEVGNGTPQKGFGEIVENKTETDNTTRAEEER